MRAVLYTGMGLPPVVVGLFVYLLLSRSGPLGPLGWLFTPNAMIVAQTIIALPLTMGLTMTSVESVSPELKRQIVALGATRSQAAWTILREARIGVTAAIVAAFGGIISEVGAVMLVGGNIAGQTRVLTTSIVLDTRQGDFSLALALGVDSVGADLRGEYALDEIAGKIEESVDRRSARSCSRLDRRQARTGIRYTSSVMPNSCPYWVNSSSIIASSVLLLFLVLPLIVLLVRAH